MYREDSDRYKVFSRRALILGGGQIGLLGLIVGRMYQLQVVEAHRYRMLADENRISMRLLPPPRGRILDRYGVPMAVNRENYRALLIAEQTRDVERTLDTLAGLISLDEHDRKRILREIRRRRSFVPVTVRENLDWSEVAVIEVHAPDLPGIVIEVGQSREYPLGERGAHVVGYVAAVTEEEQDGDPLLELPGFRIGKSGIEKAYDLELRGKAGTSQLEVNALGRVIRELDRQEGEPGKDIRLTVDVALQNFAIDKLQPYRSAAAVVMDVRNGEVLALASVPGFDPNAFNTGLSRAQWRSIVNNPYAPLTNKATSGQYAPGSTFKMVVALAALEAGVMGPDTRVFCGGYTQLGNARFHCWKRGGHGWLDMRGAIKHSCDVYLYETAKRAGIDRIAEMARRFGLGEETGIDLPGEQDGLIPTREWKKAAIGVAWQKGETLVTGIGQGFVLTTPLQLAVMTARLANGRTRVKPHLVKQISANGADPEAAVPAAEFEPLGVSPEALRVVTDGMNAVTNERRGTAYSSRIAREGWEMAGKTGTAQVRRITKHQRETGVPDNEDRPWKERDHALFVAFAPVQAPRYALSVVVEHGGGGSSVAAPIARDIMRETLKRDPARAVADVQFPGKSGGREA